MNNQKQITPIILVFYAQVAKHMSNAEIDDRLRYLRETLDRLHAGKNIQTFILTTFEETKVECINPVFFDKKKRYAQYSKIKNILKNAENTVKDFFMKEPDLFKFEECPKCKHNYDGKWACQDCENLSKFFDIHDSSELDAEIAEDELLIDQSEEDAILDISCEKCDHKINEQFDICHTCENNSNFKQIETEEDNPDVSCVKCLSFNYDMEAKVSENCKTCNKNSNFIPILKTLDNCQKCDHYYNLDSEKTECKTCDDSNSNFTTKKLNGAMNVSCKNCDHNLCNNKICVTCNELNDKFTPIIDKE